MAKRPVVLNCVPEKSDEKYKAPYLTYPNIYIPNRGLAHVLSFRPENDTEIEELKACVNEYNDYLHYLDGLDHFWELMNEKDLAVTYEQVQEKYGETVAERVFSLHRYAFETDLAISQKTLFVATHEHVYRTTLPDGTEVTFTVGDSDIGYPKSAVDGRKFLWNWMDNDLDFTYYLWEIFDDLDMIPYLEEDEGDEVRYDPYIGFKCWDQVRFEIDVPNANIERCLRILEDMGYLKRYQLHSDQGTSWFRYRGAEDGTIGLAVLDMTFRKNRLAREKLTLVLNSSEEVVKECKYILTDAKRHQYLSKEAGTYGGNLKQKIYGQFDCPSANHYIAKGQYVQQRVFFPDEETAIAAGFRPCGICMKEKYEKWKKSQKK